MAALVYVYKKALVTLSESSREHILSTGVERSAAVRSLTPRATCVYS